MPFVRTLIQSETIALSSMNTDGSPLATVADQLCRSQVAYCLLNLFVDSEGASGSCLHSFGRSTRGAQSCLPSRYLVIRDRAGYLLEVAIQPSFVDEEVFGEVLLGHECTVTVASTVASQAYIKSRSSPPPLDFRSPRMNKHEESSGAQAIGCIVRGTLDAIVPGVQVVNDVFKAVCRSQSTHSMITLILRSRGDMLFPAELSWRASQLD